MVIFHSYVSLPAATCLLLESFPGLSAWWVNRSMWPDIGRHHDLGTAENSQGFCLEADPRIGTCHPCHQWVSYGVGNHQNSNWLLFYQHCILSTFHFFIYFLIFFDVAFGQWTKFELRIFGPGCGSRHLFVQLHQVNRSFLSSFIAPLQGTFVSLGFLDEDSWQESKFGAFIQPSYSKYLGLWKKQSSPKYSGQLMSMITFPKRQHVSSFLFGSTMCTARFPNCHFCKFCGSGPVKGLCQSAKFTKIWNRRRICHAQPLGSAFEGRISWRIAWSLWE